LISGTPPESPLKMQMRSMEYNDKTIKGRATLDDVLNLAKRQYHADKNKPIAQSVDYYDYSTIQIAKKKRVKPENTRQISVKGEDRNGLSYKKFPFARGSPPEIKNMKQKQRMSED
jgi:hypothetical protein